MISTTEEEGSSRPLISTDDPVSSASDLPEDDPEGVVETDQTLPLETSITEVHPPPTTTTNDDEQWRELILSLQAKALAGAVLLALCSMLVVIWWISLLGGLSWKHGEAKRVFNWHPLLMITAFCFMTVGTLSFRIRLTTNRQSAKLLHGASWAIAALSAWIALIAVLFSHNDSESGYIANFYSLHSWIGTIVILMYVLQFVIGFYTFGWTLSSLRLTPRFKARVLTVHYFFGPFIYVSTAITIVLGIQEKEGFIGCAYSVSNADLFPIQHFFEIPLPCRVSHLLGILVIVITLLTTFAMHEFRRGSYYRQ